jgi:hypothetical protein
MHASHPRQRAQTREASQEPTEIRELPELSELAARDESSAQLRAAECHSSSGVSVTFFRYG